MSRTRTISSWSSAKTALLITSAWVEIAFQSLGVGMDAREREKKIRGGIKNLPGRRSS
jgi:hypothetical protein